MEENKNQELQELIEKAENKLTEYIKSGRYAEYLKTVSNLGKYSFTNQLLIWLQYETATKLAGYKE